MNVVVVAHDPSRRRTLIQRVEEVGWTVRADVPAEADLTPEDLDGVAVLIVDAGDAHPTLLRAEPSSRSRRPADVA